MNKKILAIIPARAGSKRLLNKNIKDFAGKPLIAWTIESALQSKYITKTIISTDSVAIALVAKNYGAEVPFMRPVELAGDNSTTKDVILHVLNECKKNNEEFDAILLLQPTSPLRTSYHIDGAIELYTKQALNEESLVSVKDTEYYYELMFKINEDNHLEGNFSNKNAKLLTQQMSHAYTPNGCIYIRSVAAFEKFQGYYGGDIIPYVMSAESSVDIDTEADFNQALKFKEKKD